MRAWILVGGRLVDTPQLRQLPKPDLVVAADGGARHAALLGVGVDHWVGDFDSSQGLALEVTREVHPTAKNETDGELATQIALERGATELVFLGAFGGRFDHTAALILGSLRLAERVQVTLCSGDEWGWPLLSSNPVTLHLPHGTTLSVVACSELVGLSLSGVRWPLERVSVPLGSGWTVSNETTAAFHARLEEGLAIVTALTPEH